MRNWVAACVGLALAVAPAAASAQSAVTPEQAATLGQQAYLYGFPLTEFVRTWDQFTSVRCPDVRGNAPVNAFSAIERLADESARTVVAPNVDTLYSIAEVDLGHGPVVLSHPAMGERYFVFELMDPYTNVVGYIGSRTTGGRAGRFAITWSGHPGPRVPGAKVVTVPSRRVWVTGRTLVRGPADQAKALKLMARYRLSPPGGPRRFARGCRPGRARVIHQQTGAAFLDALNHALADNPPPARDAPQLQALAAVGVGVGPGLSPARAGLSPEAYQALIDSVDATAAGFPQAARQSILGTARTHGGWSTPPANIGAYGTDYTTRAAVALLGFGANTPAEAIYPTAYMDATGAMLDGRRSYRLVFAKGDLPPTRAFWSLTMYDRDGYLVPNRGGRYAIGDSHPGLVRRPDGSIVVVAQRTKPAEPGVNWLPTPPGEFRLNLRLYRPRSSALDGTWAPPPIEPQAPS